MRLHSAASCKLRVTAPPFKVYYYDLMEIGFMKRVSFVLLVFITMIGCASIFPTTHNYDETLKTWIGKHVDELVKSWGPPQGSYKLSDGGTVIEYSRSRIVKYHMYDYEEYGGYQVDTLWCRTIFILDPKGIISSWKHEGNDCRSLPPKKPIMKPE